MLQRDPREAKVFRPCMRIPAGFVTYTTFFVITVYFGAVGVKRFRHALALGLLADFTSLAASLFICRLLFGQG